MCVCLPLMVFDVECGNEVPMIISDDPEVKRIFLPGILIDKDLNNNETIENKLVFNSYSIILMVNK
jgi:hypothetical protein